MNTAALAAAFRLATTLPSRTHLKPEPREPQPGPQMLTAGRIERARELEAQGMTRKDIVRMVHLSDVTLLKHLGPSPRFMAKKPAR